MIAISPFRNSTGGRRQLSDEAVSLFAMALRLGSGILLLPFILRTIPEKEMGVWYVFLSLGALAPIFDMGFSGTLARFAAMFQAGVAEATAHGLPSASADTAPNLDGLSRLYAVARRLYAFTGLFLAGALALAGPLLVFDPAKPEMAAAASSPAWWLFVLVSGGAVYAQFSNTLLRGMGRIAASQWIQIGSQFLYISVIVALVAAGAGILALAVGMLVNNVVVGHFSRRLLRQSGVSAQAAFDRDLFRKMLPGSWRMAVVSLGAYFILHTNTLLCGRFLSLEETASYGLANQLTGILEGVAGIFVGVKAPYLTRLIIQGDRAALRHIFFRALALGAVVYALGAVLLLFVAPYALPLLGSKTALLPLPMMLLFVGYRFLEFHHVQYAILVFAENKVPFVLPAIFAGALIFSVGFFTVSAFGLWGLLITAAGVQLLLNNWYPVLLGLRILNKKP